MREGGRERRSRGVGVAIDWWQCLGDLGSGGKLEELECGKKSWAW